MRTSPKSYTREQHIHSLNTALAFRQGHPWPEARRRASLQQDLDDALSFRQLTIRDGISRAGHPPDTWSRVCDGSLPNDDLAALVAGVRGLEPWRPGASP